MNRHEYLYRIGIRKTDIEANPENLKFLQRWHLFNVPFENLDIHWKNPIVLDGEKFFQKIVKTGRGGFCYELNGLFYRLLGDLGFRSRMISARVGNAGGGFGKEYDHLAILAETNGTEFLVDVGFGDFTAEPLKFIPGIEQKDDNGTFLIRKFDEEYFEVAKKEGSHWRSEYIFKDLERDLSEFERMCDFHQTSPDSHFTRNKVCSLMTEKGRKTLTDNKFIEKIDGQKKESEVASEEDFRLILQREFNIA